MVGADDGEHALESAELVHRREIGVTRVRDLVKIKRCLMIQVDIQPLFYIFSNTLDTK